MTERWSYIYRNAPHDLKVVLTAEGHDVMPPPTLVHCLPDGTWVDLRSKWQNDPEHPEGKGR